ncbi:hypothetical protein [Bacillus clarus]|uniref:Uncharacterized protein n=1 Tax=Bacillus clarus TaxID=2338372 RepID=A0A090Z245_9BACI|nr:hypothetical protein [Bacillus clarus]KFN04697.1 hypothetical protein DJ93_5914 [Bacillus clarus]
MNPWLFAGCMYVTCNRDNERLHMDGTMCGKTIQTTKNEASKLNYIYEEE